MGQFSARRRTIHARSIGDLAPDLSDHAQLATTVTGTFEATDATGLPKYVSRYVGFSRSRVSDRGMVEFDDFNEWLTELALALDDKTVKALQVFDRYADVIARPLDVTPRNILLDFDPSEYVDSRAGSPNGVLRIDDLCRDVTNGFFTLVANDESYVVAIAWDETTGRYLLKCHDLDDRFSIPTTSTGPQAVNVVSQLNREQAFRVIPALGKGTGYCIYTSRHRARHATIAAKRPDGRPDC